MSDPTTSARRPAYWEKCEAMSFGELREFVDSALDALRGDEPAADAPRTKVEFLALADMLDTKIREARAQVPPTPAAPEPPPDYDPDIPPYSRGEFHSSSELSHMEWELWRLDDKIEQARYDRGVPKWRYDHMRQEARDLRRQIRDREEEERRSWPARYAAHEKVRPGYELAVRRRNQEARRINERLRVLERQRGFVRRIKRKIESTFEAAAGGPTGRIRWRPFESAEPTPANIRQHYRTHLRRQGKLDTFDQQRLDVATELPYERWWVPEEGFGGFDAYSVFTIKGTKKVLLECPIYGNAAYVVDADEAVWKGMTKRQMIESGIAEQIPHRGDDWPAKIRQALGIG